jgi:hypothetical protein
MGEVEPPASMRPVPRFGVEAASERPPRSGIPRTHFYGDQNDDKSQIVLKQR